MKKFFILLAACTVGFMNTTNAMTNESIATTVDNDIDEEIFNEVAKLIDQYISNMEVFDEAMRDESIDKMCDTLVEFDDMTLYEATMSYLFTTLSEEIPGRGFSMERWEELYHEIGDWKKRLFEGDITEDYVEDWLIDYAVFCSELPKDECTFATCMMSKFLANIMEDADEL